MTKRSRNTTHAVQRVHELEQIADAGESDRTPLILLGEVWFAVAILVVAVLVVALVAYRLAS